MYNTKVHRGGMKPTANPKWRDQTHPCGVHHYIVQQLSRKLRADSNENANPLVRHGTRTRGCQSPFSRTPVICHYHHVTQAAFDGYGRRTAGRRQVRVSRLRACSPSYSKPTSWIGTFVLCLIFPNRKKPTTSWLDPSSSPFHWVTPSPSTLLGLFPPAVESLVAFLVKYTVRELFIPVSSALSQSREDRKQSPVADGAIRQMIDNSRSAENPALYGCDL